MFADIVFVRNCQHNINTIKRTVRQSTLCHLWVLQTHLRCVGSEKGNTTLRNVHVHDEPVGVSIKVRLICELLSAFCDEKHGGGGVGGDVDLIQPRKSVN